MNGNGKNGKKRRAETLNDPKEKFLAIQDVPEHFKGCTCGMPQGSARGGTPPSPLPLSVPPLDREFDLGEPIAYRLTASGVLYSCRDGGAQWEPDEKRGFVHAEGCRLPVGRLKEHFDYLVFMDKLAAAIQETPEIDEKGDIKDGVPLDEGGSASPWDIHCVTDFKFADKMLPRELFPDALKAIKYIRKRVLPFGDGGQHFNPVLNVADMDICALEPLHPLLRAAQDAEEDPMPMDFWWTFGIPWHPTRAPKKFPWKPRDDRHTDDTVYDSYMDFHDRRGVATADEAYDNEAGLNPYTTWHYHFPAVTGGFLLERFEDLKRCTTYIHPLFTARKVASDKWNVTWYLTELQEDAPREVRELVQAQAWAKKARKDIALSLKRCGLTEFVTML